MSEVVLAPDFEPGDGWKTGEFKVRESAFLPGYRYLTLGGGSVVHAFLGERRQLAESFWLRRHMPAYERERLLYVLTRTSHIGPIRFLMAPAAFKRFPRRAAHPSLPDLAAPAHERRSR